MPPARRETRQRVAVSAVLEDQEGFLSAQQLHTLLRERGDSVGLATVYRALQQLADDGLVDVLPAMDGETVYRRCSRRHHHHLVCRVCRRTVEVDGEGVEAWARTTAALHGFTDVEHVLEVFGTCSTCLAAPAPPLP